MVVVGGWLAVYNQATDGDSPGPAASRHLIIVSNTI
jgi:hypothetical protein